MVRFTLVDENDNNDDNAAESIDQIVRNNQVINLGDLRGNLRVRACRGYGAEKMAAVLEYRLTGDLEKSHMLTEVRAGLEADCSHVSSCDNCTASYGEMKSAIVSAMKNGLDAKSSNVVKRVFRYVTGKGLSLFDLKRLWAPNAQYN